MKELVVILDFGYLQREELARKVRALNVYCEILPGSASREVIMEKEPIGIICAGGFIELPGIPSMEYEEGKLRDFLFNVCKAKGDYNLQSFLQEMITRIREDVGDKKVLLALSGGVDSSVLAAVLSKAIPGQTTCVFVDHGFMRKNEGDEIEAIFSARELDFVRVNAGERFLAKIKGVTEPEEKRKIIGEEFVRVFEDESKRYGRLPFFAQGTNYADRIESGGIHGELIKSHHNVGGLPERLDFDQLIEPLSTLFKNEVREIGTMLGLPNELVYRQPFPGPGLAIRVMGEVTTPKLELLREADAIVREVFGKLNPPPSQYFAVHTNTPTVGIKGGKRTYDPVIAIRAVTTVDFMTASCTEIPYTVLQEVAGRISSEVDGVSRVVYDLSSKPPGSVEWE